MGEFVDELLIGVFSNLNAKDLTHCSLVCKQWRRVSRSQSLWRRLVLLGWPSQNWLYGKIGTSQLNWHKVFQEFTQASWFSPDEMKYFVCCKTIEDEPLNHQLREAVFMKIAEVISKWYQVPAGVDQVPVVDKHMELFYDTCQLDWVFLDRRRGYFDEVFTHNKLRSRKGTKRSRQIRPYQVIPSCLVMYRCLSMFRSLASIETGLTFYRVWRFHLKHVATGITFEMCDWKAGMSSSFRNGRPVVSAFRKDALELLHLLTHRHFIMRPFGLNPSMERSCYFAVSASAGGLLRKDAQFRSRFKSRKRKCAPITNTAASQPLNFNGLGKQMFDNSVYDIDERLQRWRARRQLALLTVAGPPSISLEVSLEGGRMSRQSSSSSLFSDPDSTTEDESQKDTETTSDCESENGVGETGYVANCDHFISSSHSFDTIEEQHTMQALIAGNWTHTRLSESAKTRVLYDVDDRRWYIDMSDELPRKEDNHPTSIPLTKRKCLDMESGYFSGTAADSCRTNLRSPLVTGELERSPTDESPSRKQQQDALAFTGRVSASQTSRDDVVSGVIEPLPTSLALYRLVCLFELNCDMYVCTDDASVWEIAMKHKNTGGIIYFKDFNGSMHVFVSVCGQRMPRVAVEGSDLVVSNDNLDVSVAFDGDSDCLSDPSVFGEFSAAVIQLLDLLVADNFRHPYGTIAGAVA